MEPLQVIADNVGDNVGDIAGMGSDLFGSYAESSCAALFVASISSFGITHDYSAMSYPLIISAMGIVICLITTLFATDLAEIRHVNEIEPSLKRQLLISTILMTAGIAVVTFFALPSEFTLFNFGNEKAVKNWYASFYLKHHNKNLNSLPFFYVSSAYMVICMQAPLLLRVNRPVGRASHRIYHRVLHK